ncbi:hypothetical protein [Taklimakanibacter lacteus]|uniref:hypothetical protein n=1 Tax=Taklimakanibacter lacteus TaxID=2268456 RepID=UPI000E66A706
MWTRCLLAAILACAALPAWAQEREWIFDTGDEDAYLVFGVPDSDDAGISFGCTLQSGEIRIFVPEAGEDLKPDDKINLVVTVGGKDFSFAGVTTPNEMSGTTSAEAVMRADDPIFPELRKADRFTVKTGREENTFPLEGSDFESLVHACTKG